MKKISILLLLISIISCTKQVKKEKQKEISISDKDVETAVIYEANIRQYSKKGTFNAFTKDIPKLKKLGVKIIWLMPVFPISETKRKAKGDIFVSDIKNLKERKKYLGSYYSVSDYKKINPDFGTLTDFRKLVQTAHQNGIFVILDWVANHTGWDHPWIKNHPEFYTKNKDGKITDPLDANGKSIGWTDVADLNYNNSNLHKAMINAMKYWIINENIDGFRCDVAGKVPVSFWKEAIPQLRKEKNIFMLAEAWEPKLVENNLFDMAYAWEGHHIMNEIAQGKKKVKDWDNYIKKTDTTYKREAILMNFITNHDENSWNGTVKERLGKASKAMLALTYLIPGMPLIYSGQEYDLNHRLKFFEKDSIPKKAGETFQLLKKLGALKNKNKALNGGKNKAKYNRIASHNPNILFFERTKDKDTVFYLANLNNAPESFKIPKKLKLKKDYLSKYKQNFNKSEIILKPWEYHILIK